MRVPTPSISWLSVCLDAWTVDKHSSRKMIRRRNESHPRKWNPFLPAETGGLSWRPLDGEKINGVWCLDTGNDLITRLTRHAFLNSLSLHRAFTIWAPIFLGELVSVSTQLFLPSSAPIVSFLKQLTAPYVVANAFQSLWTAAFRPKYTGVSKFISPALLGGTAFSLSKAHAAIAASTQLSFGQYLLFGFPISLHFGWVTAAALVNFNGAVATFSDSVTAKTVAAVGHVSVIVAASLGAALTITRGAPVYGGVISWALLAVADGMGKRIEQTRDEDPKRVGVYGCRVQRRLSQVGALVSGLASLYAAIAMHTTESKSK
jgi:hypothetical protein